MSTRMSYRDDAWALGTLMLLCLVIALIWMPFSLYRVDISSQFLPFYTELGENLRSFEIPGWLPTTMSGRPMAGDPISGWGYLPAMVIMGVSPSVLGFKVFLVFQILFAATATYLYARNLGLRPLGSLTAGAAFVLGHFMERTSCCNAHVQVAIWFPAIFLCIDLSQRARSASARLAWLGLSGFFMSQMVAGFVGQRAYYGGIAVVVYALYRYLVRPRTDLRPPQRVMRLAEAGVVSGLTAACFAATAVIPRLDTVSRSNLSNLYDEGAGLPDEPGWTLVMFAERLVGPSLREGRWYYGVVLLSLSIIATVLLTRRRDVLFFSLFSLGVLSLILRNSPTITLFNLLPEFEPLHGHAPDRVYVILTIGPAILAGELVDAITNRTWRPPGLLRTITALELPAVLMVAALILVKDQDNIWLPVSRIVLTCLACLVIGVAVFVRRPHVVRLCATGAILLMISDPVGRLAVDRLTDADLRQSADDLVDANLTPTDAARWLQDRAASGETFRYFGYDLGLLTSNGVRSNYVFAHYAPETAPLLVNNRSVLLGLEDIQGYNPIQIQRYVRYMEELNGQSQSYHTANVLQGGLNSPLLDLLNVRYIVIPATVPVGRPDLFHLAQLYPTVYLDDTSRILGNPNAMPRAWVVHEAITTRAGQILPSFVDTSTDPHTTALLGSKAPELEPLPAGAVDSVEFLHRGADGMRLRVTLASDGMLILSEVWDPGWSATVDGRDTRVYRANYLFRGIRVGEGTHEIVLTYTPPHVKWTLALYVAPIAVFGILGLYVLTSRWRKSRAPDFAVARNGNTQGTSLSSSSRTDSPGSACPDSGESTQGDASLATPTRPPPEKPTGLADQF